MHKIDCETKTNLHMSHMILRPCWIIYGQKAGLRLSSVITCFCLRWVRALSTRTQVDGCSSRLKWHQMMTSVHSRCRCQRWLYHDVWWHYIIIPVKSAAYPLDPCVEGGINFNKALDTPRPPVSHANELNIVPLISLARASCGKTNQPSHQVNVNKSPHVTHLCGHSWLPFQPLSPPPLPIDRLAGHISINIHNRP